MTSSMPRSGAHMTELEIASYLDRRLSLADRDRAEAHMAECAICRDEIVRTRMLTQRIERPKQFLVSGGVIAAAAAILIVAFPTLRQRHVFQTGEKQRAVASPTSLIAYGPIGETSAKSVRFAWSASTGAASYRLTLSGENGIPLWTESAVDTSLTLPATIRLHPQSRYYWIVDALLANGTTRSTGLREFQTMP
jgi:hypothetical protein